MAKVIIGAVAFILMIYLFLLFIFPILHLQLRLPMKRSELLNNMSIAVLLKVFPMKRCLLAQCLNCRKRSKFNQMLTQVVLLIHSGCLLEIGYTSVMAES